LAIFSILWHNAQEAPEGRQIQTLHILAINQHLAEGLRNHLVEHWEIKLRIHHFKYHLVMTDIAMV
jgi:hypothetical protein